MGADITLVVAMGRQNQIGLNGTMPWHLSDDLKNFKKLTTGHAVIMGRKTFDSIGKALPNRLNFVVTSKPGNVSAYEVCLVGSLDKAVKKAALTGKEIFIIGGASIYRQGLDIATKLIITHVDYRGDADTFFPDIDLSQWYPVCKKVFAKNKKNDYDFEVVTYTKTEARF